MCCHTWSVALAWSATSSQHATCDNQKRVSTCDHPTLTTEDDVGVDPVRSSHFRDRCPWPARLFQDPQLLRHHVLAPRPRATPQAICLAYDRGVHVAPTRTPTTCPLSPWIYNPSSR